MARKKPMPDPILIDEDQFTLRCIDDYMIDEGDSYRPYVDVRIDTIPPRDGDPDYSERPDLLRKTAAWLVSAADWLEAAQKDHNEWVAEQG
jgi:hypothetical protein